ncbi:MAG: hypothetical protein ABIJ48_08040 [Actinomycetota bacterium]
MKRWIAPFATVIAVLVGCGVDAPAEPTTTAAAASTTTQGTTSTAGTPTMDTPTTIPAGPDAVPFTTAASPDIERTDLRSGPARVLLAHMHPADLTSWLESTAVLEDAGYTAPAYNNRGYGGSEGGRDLVGAGADARAAAAFARSRGAGAVLFFAVSRTEAVALFPGAAEDLAGIASLPGVPAWDNTRHT